MASDKIYYHKGSLRTPYANEHRLDDTDIEFIRKDALLEKLNRTRELRIKAGAKEQSEGISVIDALTDLINNL